MSQKSIGRGLRRVPPALRYPNYRNYWFGMLGAVGGYQVFLFSQLWLVHKLTGSTVYLGYVGLANALPAIGLNLVGGVSADRLDRTRLVVITQVLAASVVGGLGIITVSELVEPWHVLVVAGLVSGINAFNEPARLSLYPQFVPEEALMSAVALNSSVWQGSRVVAPAVAGVIIAVFDTGVAIFFAAAGMAWLAIMLRGAPSVRSESVSRSPFADALEGLRYIRRNTTMLLLIGMSFFNSFFGMSYIPMMPVFAKDILYVGADAQGYLMGVGGIGALTVTMIIARSNLANHRKVLIVAGAFLFGLMITLFSITSKQFGSYPIALILMFFIGASGSTYMISIMNSLQIMVPDHMRGRVMGFYGMTWNIMPLGAIYSGSLAGMFGEGGNGVPIAVALGGILVALFAIGPAALNKNLRLATDINRSG